jgi:serine/threonine protein kinase
MRSRSFLPLIRLYLISVVWSGQTVAVKVMEQIADNIEEIEEEFLVLRDLCLHPNIPAFHGLYLKKHGTKREEDELWFVMEVSPLSLFLREKQLN